MPEGGGPICEVAVLPKLPAEGWVLHMDEQSFIDGPGMAVDLFVHYIELFWIHWVSCGGAVKVYGGRDFEVFLNILFLW